MFNIRQFSKTKSSCFMRVFSKIDLSFFNIFVLLGMSTKVRKQVSLIDFTTEKILIVRKPRERLCDARYISAYDGCNVPKLTQPYTPIFSTVAMWISLKNWLYPRSLRMVHRDGKLIQIVFATSLSHWA